MASPSPTKLSFLLLLSFLSQLSFSYSDRFHSWCEQYGKTYATEDEKLARFRVFEQNAAYVEAHNSAADSSYTLALNVFADLTPDEFRSTRLGLTGLKTVRSSSNERPFSGFRTGYRVPDSVDWRKQGAVTKVKDQGSCGERYLYHFFLFCYYFE
jgi:Cathepsin propeptide inhibitor domain (I29)/Papain family cysteine protease